MSPADRLELALRRLIAQCERSGVTQIPAGTERPDLVRLRQLLDLAIATVDLTQE